MPRTCLVDISPASFCRELRRAAAAEPGAGAGEPARPRPRRTAAARTRVEPHAIVTAAVLTGVWAWWAWKQGAYFGTVLLPGTVLLCGTIILLALTAPASMRLGLNPPARVALVAIIALACWTLPPASGAPHRMSPSPMRSASSPTRSRSASASGSAASPAAAWSCRWRRSRSPVAESRSRPRSRSWTGSDVHRYLETDGTLQFPLGYRNADGAFFCIAVLAGARPGDDAGPASLVGTRPRARRRDRCASSSPCSAQSRGSSIAMAAAVLRLPRSASPRRTTALRMARRSRPPRPLLVVGHLSPLYHACASNHRPLLDELHSAASGGAHRRCGRGRRRRSRGRAIGGRARGVPNGRQAIRPRPLGRHRASSPLAGIAAFAHRRRKPDHLDQRSGSSQFQRGESPSIDQQATRFGFNTGTGRSDIWRVALLEAANIRVLGDGAGGYRYAYLASAIEPDDHRADAHSVELETLSELGVPGLGAPAHGVRRRRARHPPRPPPRSVGGCPRRRRVRRVLLLARPRLDRLVLAVPGGHRAGGLPRRRGVRTGPPRSDGRASSRLAPTAGRRRGGLLALSAIPPFLSQRYVDAAYAEWRSDLPSAYSDLDAAARWNPLERGAAAGAAARSLAPPATVVERSTPSRRRCETARRTGQRATTLRALYAGVAPRARPRRGRARASARPGGAGTACAAAQAALVGALNRRP